MLLKYEYEMREQDEEAERQRVLTQDIVKVEVSPVAYYPKLYDLRYIHQSLFQNNNLTHIIYSYLISHSLMRHRTRARCR